MQCQCTVNIITIFPLNPSHRNYITNILFSLTSLDTEHLLIKGILSAIIRNLIVPDHPKRMHTFQKYVFK